MVGSASGTTATYSSISSPPSVSTSSPITLATNGTDHPKHRSTHGGSSERAERKSRHKSKRRHRESRSVDKTSRLSDPWQTDDRPLHVVASTSDIPSKLSEAEQELLEAKALEEEGIQMVKKALSSLNIGT